MLTLSQIRNSIYFRIVYAPGFARLYRFYQNLRIRQLRKKPQISVLFIVAEASTWKSEILYQKMLEHPRFQPILGITESRQVPGS